MLKGRSSSDERYVNHDGIPTDNQVCVYASKISNLTRGMRYLDLAGLLIKEKDESKVIKLSKVASAEKTSDLRINRLALPLFDELISHIVNTSLKINLQK